MRTRTIIALLVLLLGAAGSLWIVSPKTFISNRPSSVTIATSTTTDPRFASDLNSPNPGDTSADISEENVVRNYGREILRLNPQGQGTNNPILVPNDAVFSQMLKDEIAKPIPVQLFTEKNLVILKTTNKQLVTAYAAALTASQKKFIAPLPFNFTSALAQFVGDNNPQQLTLYIAGLSSYINSLLVIPIPSDWKSFHLEMVNLLQKRLTYAKAILENNDSQLKVAAALDDLSALLDEEQNLTRMIPEKSHTN